MTMFSYNSIPTERTPAMGLGIFGISSVLALWLRGRLWNYVTIVAMEAFVALVAALGFPVMEMILEQLMADKMRKIGDKVRAHSKRLKEYYDAKGRR